MLQIVYKVMETIQKVWEWKEKKTQKTIKQYV